MPPKPSNKAQTAATAPSGPMPTTDLDDETKSGQALDQAATPVVNVQDETANIDTSKASSTKMALQPWLKTFTERGLQTRLAMAMASKLYATHSSQSDIVKLTGPKLKDAGFDKDQIKAIQQSIRALRVSLGVVNGSTRQDQKHAEKLETRKRKRAYDLDQFSNDPASNPHKPVKTARDYDFKEVDDLEVIKDKTASTNRAPCMTAWAFVILEQMGFDRLESLSLASTFTSVTSTQHALNLGNVYTPEQKRDAELEMAQLPRDHSASEIAGSTTWDDGKKRRIGYEAVAGTPDSRGGNAQPWVTVMRRKLPVIQLTDKTWRGLSRGAAVDPDQAYKYITRNFQEATPYIIGGLRILARCYTLEELERKGYGLYVSFRPDVQGWGDRGVFRCSRLLEMIDEANHRNEDNEQPHQVAEIEAKETVPEADEGLPATSSSPA